MVFFFMIFVVLGIVSPKHRGTLVSSLFFFFIMLSNISGYYSARFYKMFQGVNWLLCTMLTSLLYPSIVFSLCLAMNLANWFEGSSATVTF